MSPVARTHAQRMGLWITSLVVGAVLVVVAVSAWHAERPSGADAAVQTEVGAEDILAGVEGQSQGSVNRLDLEMADKQDPSRLAARIKAERADPIGLRRYEMIQPRVEYYLSDGRIVYVRADAGLFEGLDIRREQAPTAGRLEGGVQIRLYAAPPEGEAFDPDATELIACLWLESQTESIDTLNFDFRVGELTTPDTLWVESPWFTYSGTDMRMAYSEVNNRIELLSIQRDHRLTIFLARARAPADDRPLNPTPPLQRDRVARGDRAGEPGQTQPQPSGSPEPETTYYALSLQDDIKVEQEGRRIAGDRAQAWFRLIDNALPPQTVAQVDPTPPVRPAMPPALHAIVAAIATQPIADRLGGRDLGDLSAPITLTWGGRLELEPVPEQPDELRDNDILVRFTAPETGRVDLAWDELNATAHGDEFTVRSPSRSFELASAGDDGTVIEARGMGGITTRVLAGSATTGVGEADGPGQLRFYPADSDGLDPDRPQHISWSDRADFVFDVEGAGEQALKTAVFSGEVVGVDGFGSIRGGFLRAEFEPGEGGGSLRRLVGEGRVSADDGRGGRLAADRIDASFDQSDDSDAIDPSYLVAEGTVVGERPDEVLRCERLEAALARNDDGDLEVLDFVAENTVEFSGRDGLRAAAGTVRGNLRDRHVELTGDGASVARGSSSVSGPAITLDGEHRSMEVFGAGTFDHEDDAMRLGAHWTTSMSFDDRSGELRCVGAVAAGVARGPLSREAISCDELLVLLDAGAADAPVGTEIEIEQERRVLSLRALGESLQAERGKPAQIRSWRYAADDPQRPERLLFLEGDEINADDDNGTLSVPGPGTLVSADLRDGETDAPESARGRTRFRWAGSMVAQREAGVITFRRDVELQHVRGDGQQTDLMCELLIASTERDEDHERSETGRLRRAEAAGAVYLRSGDREVAADRIVYDAQHGLAEATASPGNRLTMFDLQAATAATAEGLTWDLGSDRIELHRPGRIVSPRSDD